MYICLLLSSHRILIISSHFLHVNNPFTPLTFHSSSSFLKQYWPFFFCCLFALSPSDFRWSVPFCYLFLSFVVYCSSFSHSFSHTVTSQDICARCTSFPFLLLYIKLQLDLKKQNKTKIVKSCFSAMWEPLKLSAWVWGGCDAVRNHWRRGWRSRPLCPDWYTLSACC